MGKRQDAIELNGRWAENWQTPEGIEKNAQTGRRWISDHANEGSLMERVWKADEVSPEECDRSINAKTPVMIEEIREGSWALPITFDGETDAEVRMGSRYMITFFKLQTAEFRYRLEELWTSRRPVVEQMKEDMAQAYIDSKDRVFIVYTDVAAFYRFQQTYAATKLNNTTLNDGSATEVGVFKSSAAKLDSDPETGELTDTFTIQSLKKEDVTVILRAGNTAAGEQLKMTAMAITEFDYVGVTDWDITETGNTNVETSVKTVNGYNTLKDVTVHRTIKQRWLRPGNIYAWAQMDEYVGKHYRIGKVDTFQEKRGTEVISFSYGVEGFGYGNVAGVCKEELFSASDNPESADTEDTGVAAVRPLDEDHMIQNNLADQSGWIPQVELF